VKYLLGAGFAIVKEHKTVVPGKNNGARATKAIHFEENDLFTQRVHLVASRHVDG
jgi:hypothetical protein